MCCSQDRWTVRKFVQSYPIVSVRMYYEFVVSPLHHFHSFGPLCWSVLRQCTPATCLSIFFRPILSIHLPACPFPCHLCESVLLVVNLCIYVRNDESPSKSFCPSASSSAIWIRTMPPCRNDQIIAEWDRIAASPLFASVFYLYYLLLYRLVFGLDWTVPTVQDRSK